ncbi:UNVERIFIED_CONTAM: hypothetical protein GTU68_021349, partial [Idotea baltica]|nr:hypothetical protein [Idotea baltica]
PCNYYPKESPPLFYAASTAGTPFRFNTHVSDLGHTLIFGPPGSGKSTLLALMAAQARRYNNSKVFVFDKGRSMLPLTYAIPDAVHYDIGKDEKLGFCPFSKVKTDSDKLWMEEWIITILKLQKIDASPRQKKEIRSAIFNHVDSGDISFHDFVTNLQDREMSSALNSYIITDIKNYALLDFLEDGLQESNFNTFEVDELMNMSQAQALPVILYLFWQIEKQLDGSPAYIFLDEVWILLGDETFREKIREWLKVLRKSNCAVIMSTQSISDATNSGILDVINESCPTKIYLPNPSAQDESSTLLYKQLGLNIREIQLLAEARQKHDYYYRSPEGRRWFQLDLGHYALSFVGASGKEDIKRVEDLHEIHGNDWTHFWLRERGVIQ